MGRRGTSIPIDGELLRENIKSRGWTFEQIGKHFGVTRQAVCNWILEERIPPRKLADLAELLSLEPGVVDEICSRQWSIKETAREVRALREENCRLKEALRAMLDDPSSSSEVERELK